MTSSLYQEENAILAGMIIMDQALYQATMFQQHITNRVYLPFQFQLPHLYSKYLLVGIAEPYILHPKFIWFSETQDWAKWIYKYEGRPVGRKCSFECYHDNNCDYYVDVHGYCLYGRFSYTGGQIIHWTDNTYVYVQKGKSPPSSIISNNYYDAYGNKDKSASHYWNWKAGIYGHYSDISSEELCAWRCLVSWIERCMFYFWGNGHCQLGNYISSGNGYTGHIDSNTKYKVLNELSKLMGDHKNILIPYLFLLIAL